MTQDQPLFQRFLGASYRDLPDQVQRLHDLHAPTVWTGASRVTRGRGLWPRLIACVFGFPPAAEQVPVTVTMIPTNGAEVWVRQFGTARFSSRLALDGVKMTERFAPFTFTLDLHVADGMLYFPVQAGRLGPLVLPRAFLPVSEAREYQQDGRFRFDVRLSAPLTGQLVVRYQGWLDAAG